MDEQKKLFSEFAIVSPVLGLLSFVTVFGLEKAIAAVVFGALALRRLGANQQVKGKALAWAGVFLGIIAAILIVLLAVIYAPQIIKMQQPPAAAGKGV